MDSDPRWYLEMAVRALKGLHRRQEGAPIAEYAILVALVASALVATVVALRGRIIALLQSATF